MTLSQMATGAGDIYPGMDGMVLVGRIAHLLNSGLAPEETLGTVAETLRAGLGVRSVSLWLREPNATTLRAITAPPLSGVPRTSRSFAVLPDPAPETLQSAFYVDEKCGLG